MKKIFFITIVSIMILLIECVGFFIFSQFENNISSETIDAVTKNIEYTTVVNLTPIILIVLFVLIVITIVLHNYRR